MIERARRQGWVISWTQCLAVGASTAQMTALVRAGVLLRPHPAVYVVAGAPADQVVAVRAALAAAGPTATASHWTAGWLQGIAPADKPGATIHLTVLTQSRPSLTGVTIHRSSGPLSSRPYRALPCTLPARTLVDMAATATPAELADAIDRARATRIVRLSELEAETESGRRGAGALRRELEKLGHIGGPTASALEARMARLIRTYGLPEPRAERIAGPAGRYRIDYAYDQARLAIEVYGYTSHSSPAQLRKDTARQNDLILADWRVLVFTWQDVTNDPARVAAQIRAALASVSPRG